jgi:hypothetical protein
MIKFIGVVVLVIIFFIVDWLLRKRVEIKKYGLPEEIKKQFSKLEIPADKIEILTNRYMATEERSGSPTLLMGDALYDNQRNLISVEKSASVLVCHYNYKEKYVRLNSETIDISKEELARILLAQKIITVYYKSDDITNYYFDLSFLS